MGIDRFVDELIGVGLVGSARSGNGPIVQLGEGSFFAVAAVDVEAEVIDLARGGPFDLVGKSFAFLFRGWALTGKAPAQNGKQKEEAEQRQPSCPSRSEHLRRVFLPGPRMPFG